MGEIWATDLPRSAFVDFTLQILKSVLDCLLRFVHKACHISEGYVGHLHLGSVEDVVLVGQGDISLPGRPLYGLTFLTPFLLPDVTIRMSNVVLDNLLVRGALQHVAVEHVGLIPGVGGDNEDGMEATEEDGFKPPGLHLALSQAPAPHTLLTPGPVRYHCAVRRPTARAPLVHPQVQGRHQAGGDGGGPIFFVAQVRAVGW